MHRKLNAADAAAARESAATTASLTALMPAEPQADFSAASSCVTYTRVERVTSGAAKIEIAGNDTSWQMVSSASTDTQFCELLHMAVSSCMVRTLYRRARPLKLSLGLSSTISESLVVMQCRSMRTPATQPLEHSKASA